MTLNFRGFDLESLYSFYLTQLHIALIVILMILKQEERMEKRETRLFRIYVVKNYKYKKKNLIPRGILFWEVWELMLPTILT